jgi:hypothetical protein
MGKQDGELSTWLIVGGLFTLFMLGIDIWYSSYGAMAVGLKWSMIIVQIVIGILWVVEMLNFNNPNFEKMRQLICVLSVVVSIIVGINHAVAREDKQVLIDSQQNKDKQKIEDSLAKYGARILKDTN